MSNNKVGTKWRALWLNTIKTFCHQAQLYNSLRFPKNTKCWHLFCYIFRQSHNTKKRPVMISVFFKKLHEWYCALVLQYQQLHQRAKRILQSAQEILYVIQRVGKVNLLTAQSPERKFEIELSSFSDNYYSPARLVVLPHFSYQYVRPVFITNDMFWSNYHAGN